VGTLYTRYNKNTLLNLFGYHSFAFKGARVNGDLIHIGDLCNILTSTNRYLTHADKKGNA
jgi:hypothetical protein